MGYTPLGHIFGTRQSDISSQIYGSWKAAIELGSRSHFSVLDLILSAKKAVSWLIQGKLSA
jgi:hypothetical protein